MKSDRATPVAIVGGGFSGVMAAAQLARRGICSTIVEGGGRSGKGTAFSTREAAHLLNVRAESMSAFPDQPDHFLRSVEGEGVDPKGFAQRRSYGTYLRSILDDMVRSGATRVVEAVAVAADPSNDGWTISLADSSRLTAQALILAIGNQPPQQLRDGDGDGDDRGPRWIDDPWGQQAADAITSAARDQAPVLIVGTGLTMVDVILSLDAAGHAGPVTAVSRRGLVPRAHGDPASAPVERDAVPQRLVALARWLRERGEEVGWRAAVDSLRPYAQSIWQGFTVGEQRRFVRHARPWWDVHRHRIAPRVAGQISERMGSSLRVIAGRLVRTKVSGDGVEAEIALRGGGSATIEAGYAFNCTGPLHALARTSDPLLRHLFDRSLIRADQLGIGVEVDAESRVTGTDRLWALGPLTKGRYWEIIAVPDIRQQAADVAADIATELGE